MKRKMKRNALVLLAVVCAVFFAGCGKGETSAADGTAKIPKVGILTFYDTESSMGKAMIMAQDTIAKTAGIDLIRVQLGGYDDESFMTAYESMINQGANAVICVTLSETVLPVLKDLFVKNDVKYFLLNRKLSSKQMEDLLFNTSQFVGNDYCDETQNAYNMVKELKTKYDIKNLAAIGLPKGDINGDYRDAGIEAACNDLGIRLLTTTRGISTTEDVTKAVEGLIASYPEMDSIFIVGGVITNGALASVCQALENHKLQDKVIVTMVDIATGMSQYMDKGPLKLVAGGNLLCDNIFSLVVMANALNNSPLADKPVLKVNMLWIADSTDAANYDKYIEGSITPFSAEEYKTQMLKWITPSVTLDSVQKIAADFSIASVMARNAGK